MYICIRVRVVSKSQRGTRRAPSQVPAQKTPFINTYIYIYTLYIYRHIYIYVYINIYK